MTLFTLKILQFGSSNFLLLNKMVLINNEIKMHQLRSIIKEEVNVETTGNLQFNADSSEIKISSFMN